MSKNEKYHKNSDVEFIYEGGVGGEAIVDIQLRNKFPGIGGTIYTCNSFICALRKEKNTASKIGHRTFLRHLIAKKLDDFFFRAPAPHRAYTFAHVPRPFGSITVDEDDSPCEASIYEWVSGNEGFPWETIQNSDGDRQQTELKDWNIFTSKFSMAGINVAQDIADPDDGRISKNIIHMFPHSLNDAGVMPRTWQRIDFGPGSANIDFEKLEKFLASNRSRLEKVLRFKRYDMIKLAAKYLSGEIKKKEIGRLETLIGDYRIAALRHHLPRHITPIIEEGKESL